MRMVMAAVLAALMGLAGAAMAAAQAIEIGKVTRVQGAATETLGGQQVTLSAGSVVHEDSEIETGAEARLEIVFLDGSQMVLGEEAKLVMDELVYNAAASESGSVTQSFEIFAGTFRYVSGAIGRENRDGVSVRTPVATIGIRGTDFFGGPLFAGMPPGQLHYGFMSLEGAIEVTSIEGSVTLDEPEEGTFLPMNGQAAPTEPSQWTQEAIDEAFASIAFN